MDLKDGVGIDSLEYIHCHQLSSLPANCVRTASSQHVTPALRVPQSNTHLRGRAQSLRSVVLCRHAVVFAVPVRASDDTFELGGQLLVERQKLRVVGASARQIAHLGE
jgi:hypothetical protein